ncbi:hypothetical protein KAU11_03090 [Candidatus Babeliales bacterium]|nr:hypothetical protein [Candidatus Babeliales bacterium]
MWEHIGNKVSNMKSEKIKYVLESGTLEGGFFWLYQLEMTVEGIVSGGHFVTFEITN